jgi:hypothetical protein
LEKLISETNKARVNELGKIAALEYEKLTEGPNFDFSTSVRRVYQRTTLISSVKPLKLMIEIDPNSAGFISEDSCRAFIRLLTHKCLDHNISGLVLKPEQENSLLSHD